MSLLICPVALKSQHNWRIAYNRFQKHFDLRGCSNELTMLNSRNSLFLIHNLHETTATSKYFYFFHACCLAFVLEQCCNKPYLVSCFNYDYCTKYHIKEPIHYCTYFEMNRKQYVILERQKYAHPSDQKSNACICPFRGDSHLLTASITHLSEQLRRNQSEISISAATRPA